MLGTMTRKRADRTMDRADRRAYLARRFADDQGAAQRWDMLYDAFEARWIELAPWERCEHTLCSRTGLPTNTCECYEYDILPAGFRERMMRSYHLCWSEEEQVWYRKDV